MPSGTIGFMGTRLREARALTQVALAELCGLPVLSVRRYEGDTVSPSPTAFKALVDALRFPKHFFLQPRAVTPGELTFFRSVHATSKSARTRAHWRINWIQSICAFLEEHLELPRVNLPVFDVPSDPREISSSEIEALAEQTRRAFGLGDGVISNTVLLLESNGVVVSRATAGHPKIDAFSQWRSGSPPVVLLGNEKDCAARSRLDVAHELGHLILHRHVAPEFFNLSSGHRLMEDQAQRFGGAFQLPASTFSDEFYAASLDHLLHLKSRWRLSIGAMLYRARQLDLLDDKTTQSLWRQRARWGWARHEPLDEELQPERPRLLARCIDLLLQECVVEKSDILQVLPYPQDALEELLGLHSSFFDESRATTVASFPQMKRETRSGETQAGPADVVQFPTKEPL